MSDRREARVLLALLGERWEEARRLVRSGPVDGYRLSGLARSCDVAPTLHAVLERAGRFDLVGAEVEKDLGAARRKCRVDNLLLLASLEEALDLLAASGIEPTALKGVDFLHRLYASFDERTLDDIDLLVDPPRAEEAIGVLESAGWRGPSETERDHWRGSSYQMPLMGPGPFGVGLEIHWGIAQDVRYRVDVRAILTRAPSCAISGRRARRLDDHDAAAHLLLHHVQHYFDRRLKWGLDLALLARDPAFRWETVFRRLGEWGGRGAAGLALVHLRKLFPERFPEDLLRDMPAGAWRTAMTGVLRSSHPLDLYRGTRSRPVQLWIAAAALESPRALPGYLVHRVRRDRPADR